MVWPGGDAAGQVEWVFRRAVLRDPETSRLDAEADQPVHHRQVLIQIHPACAPGAEHAGRGRVIAPVIPDGLSDRREVVRTHRVGGVPECARLRGPVREQVDHPQSAIAEFPREPHAPTDRGIVLPFIRGGRIQTDDDQVRGPVAPGTAEGVPVDPVRRELRGPRDVFLIQGHGSTMRAGLHRHLAPPAPPGPGVTGQWYRMARDLPGPDDRGPRPPHAAADRTGPCAVESGLRRNRPVAAVTGRIPTRPLTVIMKSSPVRCTIPLDRDGVHHGFLRLPHSRDDSAWGLVMIPISVVRNGAGPTAILTGANHGDEYEGPAALQRLALELDPADVCGRVVIVPAFNYPAFRAGSRTSPIDGGNLNRAFPGRPDGSITEIIADYFQRTLIPRADFVLDIHSGGKTLEFVPFAAAHILDDKVQGAACVAAMRAFNAPYSMMMLEIDSAGMYDTAVENQGKVFVSTELGGGGSLTARTVGIARKGVRNFLIHAGILGGEPDIAPSIRLDMPDGDCYVFSEHAGLLEPVVDLGSAVSRDDVIARIWPLDRTGVPPVEYAARRHGILAGRHFPGLVQAGDCLGVVGVVC